MNDGFKPEAHRASWFQSKRRMESKQRACRLQGLVQGLQDQARLWVRSEETPTKCTTVNKLTTNASQAPANTEDS